MVLRLIRTVGFSVFSCSLSSYCSTCYPSRSWFDWCPARRRRACERVSVWALLHGLVEVSLFSVQCVRFWQWIVVLRCKHYLAWFCLFYPQAWVPEQRIWPNWIVLKSNEIRHSRILGSNSYSSRFPSLEIFDDSHRVAPLHWCTTQKVWKY